MDTKTNFHLFQVVWNENELIEYSTGFRVKYGQNFDFQFLTPMKGTYTNEIHIQREIVNRCISFTKV